MSIERCEKCEVTRDTDFYSDCETCLDNEEIHNENIKQLKKELGLSNKEIAEFFGMSYNAYANSSAKKRYEKALIDFYNHVKKSMELTNNSQ